MLLAGGARIRRGFHCDGPARRQPSPRPSKIPPHGHRTARPAGPVGGKRRAAVRSATPVEAPSERFRLAVYDARSFELSWNRIPNAATYRVQIGSRTVQENGATSRFVRSADLAGGFDYTLVALDRSGNALQTQRFRVQPASATQLVASSGAPTAPAVPSDPSTPAAPTTPTGPSTPASGPIRTGVSNIGGNIPVRLAVYDAQSFEITWERVPGATRYELNRSRRTVQTGTGVSRYESGIDTSATYTYNIIAINRAGASIEATTFTVSPRGATQLALGDGTNAPTGPVGPSTPTTPATPMNPMNPTAPVVPTNPATGPIRTGVSNIGGPIPVRLNVYDAQSFELTCERVSGAATYRLSRGGQVVQERNGLSRYVAGINSAASFAYTLVALDRSGNAIRSTSFTVSPRTATQLAAGGGTSTPATPANPTTPPAVNNGPIRTGQTSLAGDINVRLSVYDAKAYELFWDRVPGAVRYRFSRGGQVVQESDAVSFFVGMADSTQRFAYTLAALDRSGVTLRTRAFTVAPRGKPQLAAATGGTSAPTTPVPTGPNGPNARVIAPDTYVEVLAYAFEIYTGQRFRDDILALPGFPVDTLDFTPPGREQDGTVRVSAACDNGGTVDLAETITGDRQTVRTTEWDFENCQTGTAVRDGDFTSRNFGNVNLNSTGVEVVDGPRTVSFAGSLGFMNMSNRDGGPFRSYGLGQAMWTVTGEAPVRLTDATFLYAFISGNSGFEIDGSFRVASPFTAGRELAVTTPQTLGYGTPGTGQTFPAPVDRLATVRFSAGTLRIADPNGDSITLAAANGDPATANVTVVSNGTTQRFVEPWSTWSEELDFFGPAVR